MNAWGLLEGSLIVATFVVAFATHGESLWMGVPFAAFYLALLVEYLVDSEQFWDHHDGDWGE